MTEQPSSVQGSAASELKQLRKDRMAQGAVLAAKAAGQQAGVLAQAVRQAGEEMRQQGQDKPGQVADKVAQPVQRMSGTLSQVEPQQVTLNVKQVRPMLSQQAQQLKAQAGQQITQQTGARAAQAGQGVTTVTQGVQQTGEQLRAQGQQIPALIVDAVVEKLQPLGGYPSTVDAATLRADMSTYAQQARTRLSSASSTVTSKRQAATAHSAQTAKQAASAVRRSPLLPIGGALVGVVLAARQSSKGNSSQSTSSQADGVPVQSAPATSQTDLEKLSRAELQQRAAAAGIATNPDMTRNQLRDALLNA